MHRAVWLLGMLMLVSKWGCGGDQATRERPPAYEPWIETPLAYYDSGIYGGPERILASPSQFVANADMTVVCKRKGRVIKKWSGQAHWNGVLPDRYVAGIHQGRIVWMGMGINAKRVRIGVRADRSGGVTLDEWVPRDADELVLIVTPTGAGQGASEIGGEGTRACAPAGTREHEPERARNPGGMRGGSHRGIRGGLAPGEGVDSPNARRGGEKRGDPEGEVGGEGSRGDRGVRGAMALFGGLASVPKAVRPLVDVLLIAADVNATSLAKSWMKKPLSKLTVASMRGRLHKEATEYAVTRLSKNGMRLNMALRGLPASERIKITRRLQWALERRYFEKLEEGAAELAERARKNLTRYKSGKRHNEWKAKLDKAELMIEMTRVKPIAGSLPVNHKYAGQWVPDEVLPPAYRKKGLRFTEDGFPEFSPYAKKLPNGKKSVKIEFTGDHKADIRRANKIAGFRRGTPKKYTWHHHQDGTTMELVPEQLHRKVQHTGGRAHYTDRTGDKSAYGKDRR